MPRGGPRPGFGGAQPGAGRPKKEITDLRRRWQEKWLTEWVSDEDMQYLCQMTVGLAKRGDTAARQDVFKYLLGNPPQSVQVSGPDEGPIRYESATVDPEAVQAAEAAYLAVRGIPAPVGLRTGSGDSSDSGETGL